MSNRNPLFLLPSILAVWALIFIFVPRPKSPPAIIFQSGRGVQIPPSVVEKHDINMSEIDASMKALADDFDNTIGQNNIFIGRNAGAAYINHDDKYRRIFIGKGAGQNVFGMSLNDPLLIIYGTDGECVLRVNSDGAVVHGDAETVKKGFLRKVFK